jgi:Ca2+-binding RTX toxin-like protein
MKSKQSWWAGLLIATALLVSVGQASAQTVPLSGAFSFIGKISSGQGKIVSFNGSTGQCANVNVGNTSGLTGNTTITGTLTTDSIHIVTSPTSICGFNLTTITGNGFSLTIRASGGGDLVDAAAAAGVTLVGDSGSDILNHPSFNAILFGTSGNDELYGSTNGQFRGESGSDKMCAGPGVNATIFNGGLGELSSSNTHCGNAPTVINSTLNCGGC